MASELSRLIDEELSKEENAQAKAGRSYFPSPNRSKGLQKPRATEVPQSSYFTARRCVSIGFFCAILLGTFFVVLKGTASAYYYPSGASWLIGGSASEVSGIPEVARQVDMAVEDATQLLIPQEGILEDQLESTEQREPKSEEPMPEAEPVVGGTMTAAEDESVVGDTMMAAEDEEILRLQVQEAAAESEQVSSNLDNVQQPPATEQKQSIAKLSPALKRTHRHKHKYVSPSSSAQGRQKDVEDAPQQALQAESSLAVLAGLAKSEDEAADVETAPLTEDLFTSKEADDQQITEGTSEERLADNTRPEKQPAAGYDEEQAEGSVVKHLVPEEEAGSQDSAVPERSSEPAAGELDASLSEEEAELAVEEAILGISEEEREEEADEPETASRADLVEYEGGSQLAGGDPEVQLDNSPPEARTVSVRGEDLSWVSSEGVEPLPDIPAAKEEEDEEPTASEEEPSIREANEDEGGMEDDSSDDTIVDVIGDENQETPLRYGRKLLRA